MVTAALPTDELQKEIFDALDADVGVTADVFDDVDKTASYPFILVGAWQTADSRSTKSGGFHQVVQNIHCFSDSHGWKEANDIADSVHQALTAATLSIAGFSIVGPIPEAHDSERMESEDGVIVRRVSISLNYFIAPA